MDSTVPDIAWAYHIAKKRGRRRSRRSNFTPSRRERSRADLDADMEPAPGDLSVFLRPNLREYYPRRPRFGNTSASTIWPDVSAMAADRSPPRTHRVPIPHLKQYGCRTCSPEMQLRQYVDSLPSRRSAGDTSRSHSRTRGDGGHSSDRGGGGGRHGNSEWLDSTAVADVGSISSDERLRRLREHDFDLLSDSQLGSGISRRGELCTSTATGATMW
jgi:hypothetical protein